MGVRFDEGPSLSRAGILEGKLENRNNTHKLGKKKNYGPSPSKRKKQFINEKGKKGHHKDETKKGPVVPARADRNGLTAPLRGSESLKPQRAACIQTREKKEEKGKCP